VIQFLQVHDKGHTAKIQTQRCFEFEWCVPVHTCGAGQDLHCMITGPNLHRSCQHSDGSCVPAESLRASVPHIESARPSSDEVSADQPAENDKSDSARSCKILHIQQLLKYV
jgi:hypothetical protein